MGIFYTSIFNAILLYKLINIPPDVIKFEKFAVFMPKEGTLRIRAINFFKLPIIDVNVNMYFIIWHAELKSFSTYEICLRRNKIPLMGTKDSWNFVSKSLNLNKKILKKNLILEELDPSRKILFHPKYMDKKYMPEKANDKTVLQIHIKGQIPLFGTTFHALKSYQYDEIICGEYEHITRDKSEFDWENWGKILDSPHKHCTNCDFYTDCKITNKYIEKLHPWIRFR